jgi:hypothetical protein
MTMSHQYAITRRTLLRAGAAGALSLMLVGCGPGNGQSETPLDRLAALRHQLSSEEYMQAVVDWSKANAAVQVARAAGLPLSAIMLDHWLYGQGQPLDITASFLKATRPASQPSEPSQGTGPVPASLSYIALSLSHAIRDGLWFSGRPFWLPQHLGEFDNRHEMSAERDLNLDVHLALGRYSLRLRGHSLLRGDQVHVVPRGPIEISDTYDWINETCEGVGPLQLCQSDMRRLEGYGLGQDYQVTAQVETSGQTLILDAGTPPPP